MKNKEFYNLRRDIGVYLLRCKPLNRVYIGSTNQSFRARFSNHLKFLNAGNLGNKKLQDDFDEYGIENFEFEILGIYPETLTVFYETKFIKDFEPYYNVNKACNNSRTNTGKKFSEEHKNKIREKSKLFKHGDIEFISNQNKEGANKFKLTKLEGESSINLNSKLELSKFLDIVCPQKYYNKEYKGYFIEVLKTQRKKVQLFVNREWIEFSSYEKCDKFLNKWRGFTSTQSLKSVDKLDGYNVRFS